MEYHLLGCSASSRYCITDMSERIVLDAKQVRLFLLYEFIKHASTTDVAENICDAMGPSTVRYDTAKFASGSSKTGTLVSSISRGVEG